MKWAKEEQNFIINREYYSAYVDITDQGWLISDLTNTALLANHHLPLPPPRVISTRLPVIPDLWLPPANTQGSSLLKELWTEFGSWSLLTLLFAANKDLVNVLG